MKYWIFHNSTMQCLFFLKVLGKKLTITIKEWIEENIFHDENCLIKWKSAWNRRGKQQQPQWNFKSLVCLVKENVLISSLGEAKIYHIDNLCLVAFPEKYSWIKTTSIPIHHFLKKQTKQQQRVFFFFFFSPFSFLLFPSFSFPLHFISSHSVSSHWFSFSFIHSICVSLEEVQSIDITQ